MLAFIPDETHNDSYPAESEGDITPIVQPEDEYAHHESMHYSSDSSIPRNLLRGDDWLRSNELRMEWFDVEAQEAILLDN